MSVQDFVAAASNGNVGELTRLLNNGVDVNSSDTRGFFALTQASYKGHEAAVRLLLSRGANVNVVDRGGDTALMCACYRGHVSVAELLLKSGADHTIKGKGYTNRGKTALEMCDDSAQRARIQAIINSLVAPRPAPAPASIPAPTPAPALPAPASNTTTIEQLRAQLARVTSERDSFQSRTREQEALVSQMVAEGDRMTAQLAQQSAEFARVGQERDAAVADRTRLNTQRVEFTTQRDSLQRQLADTRNQLTQRTTERDTATTQRNAALAERDRVTAQLAQRTQERDAAIAERDQLRAQGPTPAAADVCPFVRYQTHSFVPGVVPAGSEPGLYDVTNDSSLFLYLRRLSDTGGSWWNFQRPVAGFRLARVQAVVPEACILGGYLNAQGRINRLRASGHAHFNHDSEDFSPAQLHVLNALREMFQEKAPGCSNRTVNTLHCYHGPRREHLESICSNGMVAVGDMDAGFFGSGCYTTLNMEYAVKYAYGDFDTDAATGDPTGPRTTPEGLYPIIMLAATVGMAYPLTREVDYEPGQMRSRYFGRPLKRGFDAHVVCVNQPMCQAVSRQQCEYVELVIEQQAQLLPLAVLWFEKL